jgi:small subunit ribosomal protein S5
MGDVVAKSLGSRNPHNLVTATFAALERCASPRSVANRRGKKVSELFARREATPPPPDRGPGQAPSEETASA